MVKKIIGIRKYNESTTLLIYVVEPSPTYTNQCDQGLILYRFYSVNLHYAIF